VESLKRTRTGKYRAADVDRLLLKLKLQYEDCMREQKQRIIELRNENKALSSAVEEYRTDAQYVSVAIARAQQTAKQIVEQAELKAMKCLSEAEDRSYRLHMEARACAKRLQKLKEASESVYLAACRATLPEDGRTPDEAVRAVAQAVLNLYASEQWQETNKSTH